MLLLLSCIVGSIALGCGPERLVLERDPTDGAADGAIDSPELEAQVEEAAAEPTDECSNGACDPPVPCKEDASCKPGSVCENLSCVACSDLPNSCLDPCPYGVPVPIIRNGCAVCTCPPPQICKEHAECPMGSLCSAGTCLACSVAGDHCGAPCGPDTKVVAFIRNGCPVCECAPPSDCAIDQDCGDPAVMHCYAGALCDPGCAGTPKCCYGNYCGPVGCPELDKLPCSAVGCPSAMTCKTACPRPTCKCDPGQMLWMCDPPCDFAECVASY